MLAERRRRGSDRAGRVRQLDRHAEHAQRAGGRRARRSRSSPARRAADPRSTSATSRTDAARHARRLQIGDPLIAARRAQPLDEQRPQLVVVGARAARLVAKRSSAGERLGAEHPAEPPPLLVVADRDDELAVRRRQTSRTGRWSDGGCPSAPAPCRSRSRCPPGRSAAPTVASSMPTSTRWPRPVRSRASSAIAMPCAANMPVTMSAMATPRRNGGPSAAPVMLISPPSPCITAS